MRLVRPVTRNLPEKPEDPENSKDPGTTGGSQSYSQIDQSDEHQKPVHYVPATLQVRMRAYEQTFGKNLQEKLFSWKLIQCGKDIVISRFSEKYICCPSFQKEVRKSICLYKHRSFSVDSKAAFFCQR